MPGTRPVPVLLIACLLSAAACDRAPVEPAPSALAPSTPRLALVSGGLSFTEGFDGGTISSGKLEEVLDDFGTIVVSYASGAAAFDGSDDWQRTYLRTIASTYQRGDFVAEATVTVVGGFGGSGIVFFGFGTGNSGFCEFFCEPTGYPAIYARIFPNDFGGGSAVTTRTTDGYVNDVIVEGANTGVGGNGTHRVRVTWKGATQQFTFAIDANYVAGQPFVADAVVGPITAPTGAFDDTNSHVFFGGSGHVRVDDVRVDNPIYAFSGFFAPLANGALNVAKAGSAIPVKFSLGGYEGLGIMAAGYPASTPIDCDAQATLDPVEQTVTAGASSLSYDAPADRYVYVWKTDNGWTGCRQLVVKLTDGTMHAANFKFSK
jgi:hypothetical protein